MSHFVLVFSGPFSVAVASLGRVCVCVGGGGGGGGRGGGGGGGASFGAFRAFVRFVLV